MSTNNTENRFVAQRVLATEFMKGRFQFKESDEEMAPSKLLLPTGGLANRVIFIGTLTEKTQTGDGDDNWRGRITDPTGSVYVYTGQYTTEAAAKLRELDTPEYVAVIGKPNTFDTDDGDTLISIRPESISVVDKADRDTWVAEAISDTLDRLDKYEGSEFDVTEEDIENGSGNRNYSVPIQYGTDMQSQILEDIIEALESGDADLE